MSFKDIFKKSFLEGYASTELDTITVAVALAIACGLAFYIFLVYRVMTRKTFYSKNFSISMAAMSVTTAALILTMQSSVVLSLGMVGALSIVRFRTAIKDPMDLFFLFWSISVGIICGAGLAQIAVLLSVILTVAILMLNQLPEARAPMILVVNAEKMDAEQMILAVVKDYGQHVQVKSRNMTADTLDLVVELRTAQGGELVCEVMKIPGVVSAALLSHDGEVTF